MDVVDGEFCEGAKKKRERKNDADTHTYRHTNTPIRRNRLNRPCVWVVCV